MARNPLYHPYPLPSSLDPVGNVSKATERMVKQNFRVICDSIFPYKTHMHIHNSMFPPWTLSLTLLLLMPKFIHLDSEWWYSSLAREWLGKKEEENSLGSNRPIPNSLPSFFLTPLPASPQTSININKDR